MSDGRKGGAGRVSVGDEAHDACVWYMLAWVGYRCLVGCLAGWLRMPAGLGTPYPTISILACLCTAAVPRLYRFAAVLLQCEGGEMS